MSKFERVLSDELLTEICIRMVMADSDLDRGEAESIWVDIKEDALSSLREIEQGILSGLAAEQEPMATVAVDVEDGVDVLLHQTQGLYNGMKLYAHPIPTDHFPDVGKMVVQRQEPVAWRAHPFDYGVGVDGAYAITQQEDQMQTWINKGWEVTPLYLAPTLSLDPSDELIAEIKSIANIRLVNGKAELSNIREIIHAIAHSLSCAS